MMVDLIHAKFSRNIAQALVAGLEGPDSLELVAREVSVGDLRTGTDVVVLLIEDLVEFERWFWKKMRLNGFAGPVIAISSKAQVEFGKWQPVFNGVAEESIASNSHAYFTYPLQLQEIKKKLESLHPVTDFESLIKFYLNQTAYLGHRIHNIHAPKADLTLEDTSARLNEVLEYFKTKDDAACVAQISESLNHIAGTGWEDRAYDLRLICEKMLRLQAV